MTTEANTQQGARHPISCDQVAWLNDVLDRFATAISLGDRAISRLPRAAKVAAVLEIMEVCGLWFEDAAAAGNVTACLEELRAWRIDKVNQ